MTQEPLHIDQDLHNEKAMIEAAKRNATDFAPLYEKYFEPVFRFVYQRIDDQDMGYDITTNVFVKALKNVESYEFRGLPFSSWLYRIARNELNMIFRKNKQYRTVNLDDSDVYEIIEEIDLSSDKDHYFESMIETLGELEEEDLQIVEMRFFEKRSFREIGEIVEITENNAKVRCYRILDRMKKMMKGGDHGQS